MKKYFAVLLAFILVASIIGCGKEDENASISSDEESYESVEIDESAEIDESEEDDETGQSEENSESDKTPEELLQDFIATAEGEWHRNGDTGDVKLTIDADGTFTMIYEGESEPYNYGTISYDSDYELVFLDGEEELDDGEKYSYSCSMISDDMLDLVGERCIRASESFSFREKLNGNWYLDGNTDSHYFIINGRDWYLSDGGLGSITNFGSENGENYELRFYESLEIDSLYVFELSEDGVLTEKDTGATYLRIDE